jgi:hypothetical protein
MKKKITYILTMAVITLTAFYIGRNTAPHTTTTKAKVIHTMPEKVDLSNKDQFNYICDFMAKISDWNCGGGTNDELAVSTKDGYELYAQKQENVYSPDLKQYIGLNELSSWNVDGSTLEIITLDGNTYTFDK